MRTFNVSAAVLALAIAPAVAGAQTLAIVGGDVYPVASAPIHGGTVVVRDGRIVAVGAHVPVPAGARRIDARGKIVTPGLINADTTVGLVEVQEEGATDNSSAQRATAAGFRPWDAFDSESATIAATRQEGVTTVGVMPQGAFIAGQAALVDLARGTGREMLLAGPTAMVTSFGGRRRGGGDQDETAGTPDAASGASNDDVPASRADGMQRLRDLLAAARGTGAKAAAADPGAPAIAHSDLAALVPVVQRRLPLVIEADRVDDIDAAMALGREEHVRVVIAGGTEAWKIAGRLAAAHVAVLGGAMDNIPTSFDSLEARADNVALLRRAGVEVVLVGNTEGGDDDRGFNARNIRYEAGNAVAYGMSHDDALRALTLAPATVFGVADRVGSLAPGREANIVVWSGDPFEFATTAERVLVRGREIDDRSRQDRLIERYRTLPRSVDARP